MLYYVAAKVIIITYNTIMFYEKHSCLYVRYTPAQVRLIVQALGEP